MAQESTQDHMKWLKQQMEIKRRELAATKESKSGHEIIREIIQEAAQAPVSPVYFSAATDDDSKTLAELQEKEHQTIIQELIEIAISRNLFVALKMANALKNPHLVDEFHDQLAAEYYEKLVQSKKINP